MWSVHIPTSDARQPLNFQTELGGSNAPSYLGEQFESKAAPRFTREKSSMGSTSALFSRGCAVTRRQTFLKLSFAFDRLVYFVMLNSAPISPLYDALCVVRAITPALGLSARRLASRSATGRS